MSVEHYYTCDRCGKSAESGISIEARCFDSRYSSPSYRRLHLGSIDLCLACKADVWTLLETDCEKQRERALETAREAVVAGDQVAQGA